MLNQTVLNFIGLKRPIFFIVKKALGIVQRILRAVEIFFGPCFRPKKLERKAWPAWFLAGNAQIILHLYVNLLSIQQPRKKPIHRYHTNGIQQRTGP